MQGQRLTGAERLWRFRRQKNWSLRLTAKQVGVSHALNDQIERGKVKVTAKTARKLAPLIGLDWHKICD